MVLSCQIGGDHVVGIIRRRHDEQHDVASRQTLEVQTSIPLRFHGVRITDRLLYPCLVDTSTRQLKFRVLVRSGSSVASFRCRYSALLLAFTAAAST